MDTDDKTKQYYDVFEMGSCTLSIRKSLEMAKLRKRQRREMGKQEGRKNVHTAELEKGRIDEKPTRMRKLKGTGEICALRMGHGRTAKSKKYDLET